MSKESIKVLCRIRPVNQREKESGFKQCLAYNSETVKIQIESEYAEYTYDKVFGPDTHQIEIFETAAKPIIQGALEGYNGTLLCYGQTSSGKTFTMEGIHEDIDNKGIIPRMMELIFELILKSSTDIHFSVKCSYLEIYNEKIQDLLDLRKNNLIVKEEKDKGIWVQDASEVYVSSKEEMYSVFQTGAENRRVGSTLMNQNSSRSHSLFIVTIFQQDRLTEGTKTGKLYFVDLAGSEKISKTGAEGLLLEEAKNINKSLMVLGMVINSLSEAKSHIPYRDSKLTRILQESLGGNSQTTLIVTCSPNAFNDKETLSTLRFGQRAKNIKNKVFINTEQSTKELLKKLNDAEEKIKNYQILLEKTQMGKLIEAPREIREGQRDTKCEDCNLATRKLLNLHIELVTANEELEKAKFDIEELEAEIDSRTKEIYELNDKLFLNDVKTKLFIEEEIKTFEELQIRVEHIFLLNQQKLIETNKLKFLIEKVISEREENEMVEVINIIETLEDYIQTDNKNFDDLIELILNNNNIQGKSNLNNINVNINKNININIINKPRKLRLKKPNIRSKSVTPIDANTNGSFILNTDKSQTDENNESLKNIMNKQRKLILELTKECNTTKQSLSNVRSENSEKEKILNIKNEETIKINIYENKIKDLEEKLQKQTNEFEEYKNRSMADFKYKEDKLIELFNKVSDLEEINYRLINFNKDKEMKRVFVMEKQLKDITTEATNLHIKNTHLKDELANKNEEIKRLLCRITELENQSISSKLNDLSFIRQDGSPSNFKYSTLNEMLRLRLRSMNGLSGITSNTHSPILDKDKKMNEFIFFSNNSDNKSEIPYSANIQKNLKFHTAKTNSSNNMMKMIRGGGGVKENFFNKMLGNLDNEMVNNNIKSNIDVELFKKEKYELEMKTLENDNYEDDDKVEISPFSLNENTVGTPSKKKNAFWKILNKILPK